MSQVEIDPFQVHLAGLARIEAKLARVQDVSEGADASASVNEIVSILQDDIVPFLKEKISYDKKYAEAVEEQLNECLERVDGLEAAESSLTEEDAEQLREYIESSKTLIETLIPSLPKPEHKMAARAIVKAGAELLEWIDEVTASEEEGEDEEEEGED